MMFPAMAVKVSGDDQRLYMPDEYKVNHAYLLPLTQKIIEFCID